MFTTNNILKFFISLNYLKHHFNKKRNLVIHHGLMGSAKNFRTLSKNPAFSQHVNSYLIDARNHGSSPHTQTHSVKDLADDLFQFLQENTLLNEDERLTLMGHSMGGMALMQFTKRYHQPAIQRLIDRVIIIDIPATPVLHKFAFRETGNMIKSLQKIDLSLTLGEINRQIEARAVNKDVASLIKSQIVKDEGQKRYRWKVNLQLLANKGHQSLGAFDLRKDNPKKWEKPIQLIYGEFSEYFDNQECQAYRQCYEQMSQANFHKIGNAKHWVHFDNTKKFLEVIGEIIRRDEAQ